MNRLREIMGKKGDGSPVSLAIEREDWEMAALLLLLGFVEVIDEVGAAGAEALLDELEAENAASGGRHGGSRGRRRGEHGGRR